MMKKNRLFVVCGFFFSVYGYALPLEDDPVITHSVKCWKTCKETEKKTVIHKIMDSHVRFKAVGPLFLPALEERSKILADSLFRNDTDDSQTLSETTNKGVTITITDSGYTVTYASPTIVKIENGTLYITDGRFDDKTQIRKYKAIIDGLIDDVQTIEQYALSSKEKIKKATDLESLRDNCIGSLEERSRKAIAVVEAWEEAAIGYDSIRNKMASCGIDKISEIFEKTIHLSLKQWEDKERESITIAAATLVAWQLEKDRAQNKQLTPECAQKLFDDIYQSRIQAMGEQLRIETIKEQKRKDREVNSDLFQKINAFISHKLSDYQKDLGKAVWILGEVVDSVIFENKTLGDTALAAVSAYFQKYPLKFGAIKCGPYVSSQEVGMTVGNPKAGWSGSFSLGSSGFSMGGGFSFNF